MVAVGGWRGTGTTTTALLLAAALAADSLEPTDGAWFVEADPAGGVLAGRMSMSSGALGGLEQLAFPPAGMSIDVGAVAARHGALSIVLAPADPFRADACHRARSPWLDQLSALAAPVVVDVGRLRPGAPTRPILERADVLLVVTTPEVSAAVSTVEWVHAAGRVSSIDGALNDVDLRVAMVDAPSGVSFPRATVTTELGERLVGWLPWDPSLVHHLHAGGALDDRRTRRSGLAAAAVALARRVTAVATTLTGGGSQ